MKEKKIMIKIVILASLAVSFFLAVKFAAYGIKTGYDGISPMIPVIVLVGLLFAFLFFCCICTWVYLDCMERGDDGLLWAVIVFVTTPFIGLLIYFLRRKEPMTNCASCSRKINKSAYYCEYCGNMRICLPPKAADGSKNEITWEEEQMKSKNHWGLLAAGFTAAVIMLGCFTTFTVITVRAAVGEAKFVDTEKWNTGVVVASYNVKWDGVWKLKLKYASKGFREKNTFTIQDNTQTLNASIQCGEVEENGKLLLIITQGDIENTIDVTNLEEPLEYKLTDYQPGKIKVVLEINKVKDITAEISLSE